MLSGWQLEMENVNDNDSKMNPYEIEVTFEIDTFSTSTDSNKIKWNIEIHFNITYKLFFSSHYARF